MRKVKKKMFCTKKLCWIVLNLLLVLLLTGCVYTYEEIKAMGQYKKQGEINALNYVKEKYAFDATVEKVVCERTDGGGDPSPPMSGKVYVTLKYNEKSFVVRISGEEVTTLGEDNYQYESIKAALEEKLYTITNLPAEELFLYYGNYSLASDMVDIYFDGNNLLEIFEKLQFPLSAVVTYINQDIANIDREKVTEQTGIKNYLFVDYDSKEHYDTIKNPAGDWEKNLLYVNQYLDMRGREDTYVCCEKQVTDGIVLIPEYAGQQVELKEKTDSSDDISDEHAMVMKYLKQQLAKEKKITLENPDKKNQVYGTYVLNTESEKVNIYVPLDRLYIQDYNPEQLQFKFWNRVGRIHTNSTLTDDEKYIGVKLYKREYEEVEFSLFLIQN